ncbi:hypothetical protein KC19_8G081600 [Ceratodon purpureus]|uniref:Uncharacterized protein n=1 Tax=Ceratodon purpureus TaxID=3225 RepID=A0A8T0GWM9_CERPU|nr:hypothetical protein KC19_8G081600 [Ceratodon purpureus]
MAEPGASALSSGVVEENDASLERSNSESRDTEVKVTAADDSVAEAVSAGGNEVAVVTSLRDAANMGAKEMSVDESHRSEAVTPSQAPVPTKPVVPKGLKESRAELLERVQSLKKDLENWRGKLDTQVKSYREELGELRSSLNFEVEQLRVEFQDLRNTLKQQREVTSTKLAKLDEPSDTPSKSNLPLPTVAVGAEE